MSKAHEFYTQVNGKAFDVDGYYGAQCWDGYAYYSKWLGVPYANCSVSGYAQDIFEQRATNGMLKYFDVVDRNHLQDGDIVVFDRNADLPGSHIGIFRTYTDSSKQIGTILGQNQRGNGNGYPFTQDNYYMYNALGGFRLKQAKPKPQPAKPQPKPKIVYRAHVQDKGWLPGVKDGQTAGITGHSLRVEALMIDCAVGKLKVQAQIQDIGWVNYGIIDKNTIIGTTGQGKRLEALIIEPIGFKLEGRVHLEEYGWGNWTMLDGKITLGTSKESRRLEGIQLKVV